MKKRPPKSHRWLGLTVLLVGLLSVSVGYSTTVLKLDLESLVANSNDVVHARVESMHSFRKDGQIYTDTTLEIVECWKGDVTGEVTVRQPGGRVGEMTTRVHGLPEFRRGEETVVFLESADETGSYIVTGMRQGKFHVAVGPDGATKVVVPRLGEMRLLEPTVQTGEDGGDAAGEDAELPETIDASELRAAEPADVHERVFTLEAFRERVRRAVEDDHGPSPTDPGGPQ